MGLASPAPHPGNPGSATDRSGQGMDKWHGTFKGVTIVHYEQLGLCSFQLNISFQTVHRGSCDKKHVTKRETSLQESLCKLRVEVYVIATALTICTVRHKLVNDTII